MKTRLAAVVTACLGNLLIFTTSFAGNNCGCDRPTCQQCQTCQPQQVTVVCKTCKHHGCGGHCHRDCCCGNDTRPRETAFAARRFEAPPRAAVVESVPMFQATPGIFAMPMMMPMQMPMMNVRAASFVEEPRSRAFAQSQAAEKTCAASGDRLDELEEQMDALNLRIKTIQRSVEIQTRIWEEMKAEGKFPKSLSKGEADPEK